MIAGARIPTEGMQRLYVDSVQSYASRRAAPGILRLARRKTDGMSLDSAGQIVAENPEVSQLASLRGALM